MILGVIAALWMKTFTVSYLGDFLRRDVLFKVVPWFTLYFASKVSDSIAVAGFDFNTLANTVFGLITVALAGSILSSLYQLKLTSAEAKQLASGGKVGGKALTTLFGPENPRAANE